MNFYPLVPNFYTELLLHHGEKNMLKDNRYWQFHIHISFRDVNIFAEWGYIMVACEIPMYNYYLLTW